MTSSRYDNTAVRAPGARWLIAFAGLAALSIVGPETPTARADAPQRVEAWSASWGAPPVFPLAPPGGANLTIRQTARLSVGGELVRVRLSNETGTAEVSVGAAHVAIAGPAGAILIGSDRPLTFSGKSSIVLRAGAPALSDPVRLRVRDLETLAVSIYLPAAAAPIPGHLTAISTTFVSAAGSGNATAAVSFPTATTTTTSFLLSRIDVVAPDATGVIVALGDSITDGFLSTVDANRRWPDVLAERERRGNNLRFGVVNAGLSGNRVLHDQPNAVFGPDALARFDRDVLAVPGVTHITLMEGINDIGQSNQLGIQEVTADEIIDGYKQLVARAHERGLKIFGATLTPFAITTIANYFTEAGEVKRQAVNRFIRTSGLFDGVIDFDVAIRNPADPTRMLPAFDSGDHLHPNDAGYRAMAEAVDLRLFER